MFETYLKDYHQTEVEREQEEQDALESETHPGHHIKAQMPFFFTPFKSVS
ncbi:hypothetical protein AZE42_14026 [Rhizopogon vesiculosus]|uniref:Uncharacterized protein n=1 Tax=Rhizopogon vesiculosus TaxID=180088 RepID=A0A1J8Q4L1_9AGAM|nr:hypothetical protein AZE42_14026 [Rhizopogon vesiculosus]